MTTNAKYFEYFNEIFGDSLKCFWDERGLAARYRNMPIGVERFLRKNPDIVGKDLSIEEAMEVVKKYLLGEEIAKDVKVTNEHEFVDLIKMEITDCIHRSVEENLWNKFGIRPIACPCGNLLLAALSQGETYDVEMAQVKCEENGKCRVVYACFIPPDED